MATLIKKLRLCLYRYSSRYVVIFSGVLGIFMFLGWVRIFHSSHKQNHFLLPSSFIEGVLMVLLLLVTLGWLTLWGWYLTSFRFVFYFIAWLLSRIRRLFMNRFVQFFMVFFALVFLQKIYKTILKGSLPDNIKGILLLFDEKEILQWQFLLVSLVLTIVTFIFIGLFKLRKHIIIDDFTNNTGCGDLDNVVKGLSKRLVAEIMRSIDLYKTIDDMIPIAHRNQVPHTVTTAADISEDLMNELGAHSEITVGMFKISLESLLKVLGRMVQSHKLSGCLHREGKHLVLSACISGGHLKGNWIVRSVEIPGEDFDAWAKKRADDILKKMVEDFAMKIFTEMVNVGSPRWEAVKDYTEGLRKYRETMRTAENRILHLQEAKTSFNRALASDTEFTQCYYNLGIIYRSQGNYDSAEAAFCKVLEKTKDNFNSFYELASNLWKIKKDFTNAKWFCEQAILIFPNNPQAWNLKSIIHFGKWYDNEEEKNDNYQKKLPIPGEFFEVARNAAMLSWRQLCITMIKGKDTRSDRLIARTCMRNLGVLKGMKKSWYTPWHFYQALFLSPDDQDIYFELGQTYYRREKYKKVYDTYFKIFEKAADVYDSILFWALYFHAYAHGYKKIIKNKKGSLPEKDKQYFNRLENLFSYFLDALAVALQREPHSKEDKIPYNLNIINTVYGKIKEYHHLPKEMVNYFKYISESHFEESLKKIINMKEEKLKERLERIEKVGKWRCAETKSKYWNWHTAQLEIALAKQCLKYEKCSGMAIQLLNGSIEVLENNYPREIKKLRLNYYLASGYLNEEKYPEALYHVRQAVRDYPFGAEERFLQGRVYLSLNNHAKALKEMERSFRLEPNNPDILKEIGKVYKEKAESVCDPKERKMAFDSAIKLFGDALEIKGSHSFADDKPDSNIQIDANDDPMPYMKEMGLIYYYLGHFYYENADYGNRAQYNKSASYYQTAVMLGYEPLQAQIMLGWVYINAELFSRAKSAFDRAEEMEKQMQKDKKLPEADRSYFIDIKLGQAAALVMKSVNLIKDNDRYEEIKGLLDIVYKEIEKIKIDKIDAKNRRFWVMYYEYMGKLFFKAEDYEEAIEFFSKAVGVIPLGRNYYRLGLTYQQYAIQDNTEKRNFLIYLSRHAAELSLSHDLRERYKKLIEKLQEELMAMEKR